MSIRIALIAALLAATLVGPVWAAKPPAATASGPKSLGTFGVWNAYSSTEGGQQVCYMLTKIRGTEVKKLKRAPVWLMITQRPGESAHDVISYNGGYNFKANQDVDVHIGKDSYSLFTQKDTAWSRDAMTDHNIAAAIRKNAALTITGSPAAKGTPSVTDTFSLKGGSDAYYATAKACGMSVDKPKPAKATPVAKKKPATRH